ncbi:hypothetical protein JHK85_040840 [Glycine max]|nr:hypothetical protein JHK86_040254 [Glycine max]KAG4965865.1 hypothetical protein JHK85_040840 [Glycine max]
MVTLEIMSKTLSVGQINNALPGEDVDSLGLTGQEGYTIDLPSNVNEIRPGQDVTMVTDTEKSFVSTLRFDTEAIFYLSSLLVLVLSKTRTDLGGQVRVTMVNNKNQSE